MAIITEKQLSVRVFYSEVARILRFGVGKIGINQKIISEVEGETIFKKAIDNGYSPTIDKII